MQIPEAEPAYVAAETPDVPEVAAPTESESAETVQAGDAVRRKIRSQKGRQSTFLVNVGKSSGSSVVGDA